MKTRRDGGSKHGKRSGLILWLRVAGQLVAGIETEQYSEDGGEGEGNNSEIW